MKKIVSVVLILSCLSCYGFCNPIYDTKGNKIGATAELNNAYISQDLATDRLYGFDSIKKEERLTGKMEMSNELQESERKLNKDTYIIQIDKKVKNTSLAILGGLIVIAGVMCIIDNDAVSQGFKTGVDLAGISAGALLVYKFGR